MKIQNKKYKQNGKLRSDQTLLWHIPKCSNLVATFKEVQAELKLVPFSHRCPHSTTSCNNAIN